VCCPIDTLPQRLTVRSTPRHGRTGRHASIVEDDERVCLYARYWIYAWLRYRASVDGPTVTWGIVAVLVLVTLMAGALFARRRRTSQASGREEQLRLAKRAVIEIAKASRRTKRGSQRGNGTGADTSNDGNAMYYGSATQTGRNG
jgi:hypothetical protein